MVGLVVVMFALATLELMSKSYTISLSFDDAISLDFFLTTSRSLYYFSSVN